MLLADLVLAIEASRVIRRGSMAGLNIWLAIRLGGMPAYTETTRAAAEKAKPRRLALPGFSSPKHQRRLSDDCNSLPSVGHSQTSSINVGHISPRNSDLNEPIRISMKGSESIRQFRSMLKRSSRRDNFDDFRDCLGGEMKVLAELSQ